MVVDRLAEVVAEAARRALAAILRAHPGEHLVGYALCTDDDLRSLYAVGCTREFLAGRDPDWRFLPNEWPYDDVDDCFGDACRMLWARADATDEATFGQHVRQSFQFLVAALKQLRSEGAVADDVLLVALSTDPGEHMTALEDGAVRELNPAEVYRQWKHAVG